MIAQIRSAVLSGVSAIPVEVQVQIAPGLPSFNIVGMADTAVAESRERVRAAFKSANLTLPTQRVTVNLAPAHLRKIGSGLDLPIATALMIAVGHLDPIAADRYLVVGELSLAARITTPPGIVAFSLLARDEGRTLLTGPLGDLSRIVQAPVAQVASLTDLRLPAMTTVVLSGGELIDSREYPDASGDYADVIDQEAAIRALTVAAVGGHNLMMLGEPGTGKTMLARRLPSILAPLDDDQLLEVAQIHSTIDPTWLPTRQRPFRSPHHSASTVGMIGGGSPIRPGEVTLAHQGVLFLDEMPEFKPATLQMLRQPLESGEVWIVRASESARMPARFQLVATANPCPCGYYGSSEHPCRCTMQRVEQYRARLGGPLMDRIDMTIAVGRPNTQRMIAEKGTLSTRTIRMEVERARQFRSQRSEPVRDSTLSDYVTRNNFTDEARRFLDQAARTFTLSGRALRKACTVARTIADLSGSEEVDLASIAESMQYRNDWMDSRANHEV